MDEVDPRDRENAVRCLMWTSACVTGDLDSVKRLISEGVDYLSDNYASGSLLITCRGGQCEILKYLITLGVDVDIKDSKGKNAVHQCAISGKLECLKILVDNGADLDVEYNRTTLLQQASASGHVDIVEYLTSFPLCTRAEKIEALELLGAAYASDENDLQSALNYWLRSLEERGRAEPGDNVPPKRDEPHPVFGNISEFQTEQELTAIAFSFDEMWMQSLIIRERIFGPEHRYSYKSVTCLAIVYAERGNFDRSVSLITYIFDVEHQEQESGIVCLRTLKAFCSLIDNITSLMRDGFPVRYKDVMAVFMKIVDVLEHNVNQERPWNRTFYHNEFHVLSSIGILAQLQPSISENDILQLHKVLYRLVHMNLRDEEGHTLLHLVCKNYIKPYSPLEVAQLLLEVGADPRAVSYSGDTPLHTAARKRHDQQRIIQLLLDSGAHYDTCNDQGECFTDLLASDNVFKFENPMKFVSLQCLSAKAVLRYGIPFESKVPSVVSEFIEMH